MKKFASLFFLYVIVSASLTARAQTPSPAPTPTRQQGVQPADEDSVVRITTNLVQIDAVVTDSKGRLVTNLGAEDFEVLVNGKPQKITNFSLVTNEVQTAGQPVAGATRTDRSRVPVPPAVIRPEQVRRTIALVVDDLTLSFESMNQVRQALKRFVDEQMQPGDLVAIVRVSAGVGALQQFTFNKQQLYAAIENIKYNPLVGRLRSFEPGGDVAAGMEPRTRMPTDSQDRGIVRPESPEKFRDDTLARASLGVTSYVVSGMRDLPGRKAVLLLSEGYFLVDSDEPGKGQLVRRAIERLIDSSSRAGVVVYTMDARGLVAEGMTPSEAQNVANLGVNEIQGVMRTNREKLMGPQDGLRYIAERTGGFAIYNSNDLGGGIRRTLDDQKSYYLIGFQPDASAFDASKVRFNHLTVRVKGPGLKVRYRSGFLGITDEEVRPIANSPERQIMRALASPFASDDINLRLTALFGNDAAAGSFVRSLVHISTEGLTFTRKPDGMREAVINVVAYTFNESGAVISSVGETHTVTLSDKLYDRALQSGLVYSLNVPIKKSGAYQLRVAVRDDKSAKVGSASQFINVPDVGKDKLALSGIALSGFDPVAATNSAGVTGAASGGETASMLTQAAMRRFRAGQVMQFAYVIFNAKADKGRSLPQLVTQIRLYRDGKEIFAGRETPYEARSQADMERLVAGGSLQLGGLQPGEYALQVIVTDLRAETKNRTAINWIDFEVVK
ncbi:MAG TPA: VWA domain-containing protein [Pyrinomonadaceae bacterium]